MRRVSLSFAFDEERITDQDKIEVAGHEVMDASLTEIAGTTIYPADLQAVL
jgi:hypothetical protein